MKLKDLAERLECRFVGDPELELSGIGPIEAAEEGELSFLNNRRYLRHLAGTKAAAIILEDSSLLPPGKAGIVSGNPYLSFAEAVELFHPAPRLDGGISRLAEISETARIGAGATIGPFTIIGPGVRIGDRTTILSHCVIYPEVEIGEGTLIHANCVIREGCIIGAKVILQNNVTIGSDGFGYAKRADQSWKKIRQAGIVVIEDEVEIGAGSVVDRASIGKTLIRKGAKIDNLGLAGSTTVGNDVILSGQVGAAGHLEIGDRVIATAQTGIPNSVEAGKVVSGYPAIDNRDWLRSSAVFAQLPKLQKEIRELRNKINLLEELIEK
jgi:UDP-3-O-[3-hydroxymyristoyl] glucosamine N-acyltransferase